MAWRLEEPTPGFKAMTKSPPEIKVIVLCGPTGIGKTSSALEIARDIDCQVISADSMQIYRYMDIGTAKPSGEERAMLTHHMIDVVNPDEPYDANRYACEARPIANRLHHQGRIPLIVGGTGLYIKALLSGLFASKSRHTDVRLRLKAEAESLGVSHLYERIRHIDPTAADRIHPNDAFRIIRALEVFETTGKPISYHQQRHCFKDRYFVSLKFGLMTDRDQLYQRIDQRVVSMVEQGFVEEVKNLLDRGYSHELNSMQAIGYKQMVEHLFDKHSLDETVSRIQQQTRRYAKRQLTWFRADHEILWIRPERKSEMVSEIKRFLSRSG
jgi:tRNA dimethylallyltransferase